jgi:tetrapyrrole methylase family protein/MazG family protein
MNASHTLTIVGLGPGDADDMTRRAWRTLEQAEVVYLRTERHPCVPHLPRGTLYESFDHFYEAHEQFDEVYDAICDYLLDRAQQEDVVYAVPGDPMMGETTVLRLLTRAPERGVRVEIVHGVSFVEPALCCAGIDGLEGLQILDGMTIAAMHHPPINPSYPALIGGVYSREVASDVKLTLMNQYPDDHPVLLIHAAGTQGAAVEKVALYEIDRSLSLNHLSSLMVPPLSPYSSFESFQETIAHLRAPEGCPWDRKQTHASLRPYLIEEAYEVLDAIDREAWNELAGELGDLLLQVVLHAQIATEEGEFQMADVLEAVNRKMIRRHPHVWGDVDVRGSAEQVRANWDELKRAERAHQGTEAESLLDGVNKALPALMVAHEYQRRAAKAGFDWPSVESVKAKAREELTEILNAEDVQAAINEIGDLIFLLVNWLRWLGVDDPESVVRAANAKFYRRFRYVEQAAAAQGRTLDMLTGDEIEAIYQQGKAQEQ